LIADRVVAWLIDRYAPPRRRSAAARPLLVASFVNPRHRAVPDVGPARSAETIARRSAAGATGTDRRRGSADQAAAQIAFREAYYSGYGPAAAIERIYRRNAQRYRDLYYRLHAEVDVPIDRVRRAVTDGGSENAVLVRTADHGDLLGAHGGLHQKWFNLYDEATRVPFVIARIGEHATEPRVVSTPTSHVDWFRPCSGPQVSTFPRSPPPCVSRLRGAPAARPGSDAGGGRRAGRRPAGRVPDDPGQHARRRHRCVGAGAGVEADVESACAAENPDSSAYRVQFRGIGGAGR
jgi:hypothetical protein